MALDNYAKDALDPGEPSCMVTAEIENMEGEPITSDDLGELFLGTDLRVEAVRPGKHLLAKGVLLELVHRAILAAQIAGVSREELRTVCPLWEDFDREDPPPPGTLAVVATGDGDALLLTRPTRGAAGWVGYDEDEQAESFWGDHMYHGFVRYMPVVL